MVEYCCHIFIQGNKKNERCQRECKRGEKFCGKCFYNQKNKNKSILNKNKVINNVIELFIEEFTKNYDVKEQKLKEIFYCSKKFITKLSNVLNKKNIKKNRTSYNFFYAEMCKKVNIKQIGKLWRECKDREKYCILADQDKERYKKELKIFDQKLDREYYKKNKLAIIQIARKYNPKVKKLTKNMLKEAEGKILIKK